MEKETKVSVDRISRFPDEILGSCHSSWPNFWQQVGLNGGFANSSFARDCYSKQLINFKVQ